MILAQNNLKQQNPRDTAPLSQDKSADEYISFNSFMPRSDTCSGVIIQHSTIITHL